MALSNLFSLRFFASLLRLTRTGNLIIIALAQYFTAGFIVGVESLLDLRLLLLAASTMLIAAAGYIINDYYDQKIDYINKPDRVEIGKSVTRRYAILMHVALSVLGVIIGAYLSLIIGAINILSVFLLWLYSNLLKRLPFVGNFVVGVLTALAILVVDVLYPGHHQLILIYALFAFFMTLIREIIKDMEDLKGDSTFGCKTLPIVFGIRRTKMILYIILITFSASVFFIDRVFAKLPEYYFLILLVGPLLLFAYRLRKADTKQEFHRLSVLCKIILLLGIVSMAYL